MIRCFKAWGLVGLVLLATGCATQKPNVDYTAFRQHPPKSILVLPPLNNTTDVRATYSLMSTVTWPLAESGYYVFPVALVDQTFKENGLPNPAEMHQASPQKMYEIFGADAVLYITVNKYGAGSALLGSAVVVTVDGQLMDTQSGVKLWQGSASASDAEGQQNNNGLIGLLVQGIIKQVANSVSDPGQRIGGIANARLLSAHPGGLLYGPRSPKFEVQP